MENYSEKLMKEIKLKLVEVLKIEKQQEEIERDTALSGDVLFGVDPDTIEEFSVDVATWQDLERKRSEAVDALNSALIRANYYPITLHEEKWRPFFSEVAADVLDLNKDSSSKAIKDLLDELHETGRDEMSQRYQRLKPLFFSDGFDVRLLKLHQQVMRCFVNGAFEASCILCRAVTEVALKIFLEKSIPSGQYEDSKLSELIDFCERYKLLSGQTIERARDNKSIANDALHRKKVINEQIAFDLIQSTRIVLCDVFSSISRRSVKER